MRRVLAIARKEVLHIARDPRSLAIAILMPLAMLMVFGYAIDMELSDLPIAVLDLDHTDASRDLVRTLTSSGFIAERARLGSRDEIEPGFRRGRFRAAIVIPRDHAATLAEGRTAPVQALVDGADGTTAATVGNYLDAGVALANARLRTGAGPLAGRATAAAGEPTHAAAASGIGGAVDLRPRVAFNPELVSTYFIVPGLVAIVLTMICALLTSVALTREKETGTLEQMLMTPVSPAQVVVGKLLPYMSIGVLDAALILGLGRLVFHVPMTGSWWVLAGYSLLFVLISLALGLLISTIASTQRVAMMVALLATFLPSLILSGFVFDHASMPVVLRALGQAIPATHYLVVIRGVMLVGGAWYPVQGGVMLAMLIVLLAVSTRKFRMTLE